MHQIVTEFSALQLRCGWWFPWFYKWLKILIWIPLPKANQRVVVETSRALHRTSCLNFNSKASCIEMNCAKGVPLSMFTQTGLEFCLAIDSLDNNIAHRRPLHSPRYMQLIPNLPTSMPSTFTPIQATLHSTQWTNRLQESFHFSFERHRPHRPRTGGTDVFN